MGAPTWGVPVVRARNAVAIRTSRNRTARQRAPGRASRRTLAKPKPRRRGVRASAALWNGIAWGVILPGVGGLWLEKRGNAFVRTLSAPLLATLLALVASNGLSLMGIHDIASSPAHSVVSKVLLPLAVPMLLLGADLKRVFAETRALLAAFLLGSIATLGATVIAYKMLPLAAWLGDDGWRIASALCARHIGGAVNFVAVAHATSAGSDAVAAALAADNLMCALYFITLFWLSRDIPAESREASDASDASTPAQPEEATAPVGLYDAAWVLGLAAAICWLSAQVATRALHSPGLLIPVATCLSVGLATWPATGRACARLAPAGETLAALVMQMFFASVGASGDVAKVVRMAPALFAFSFAQIALHLGLLFGAALVLFRGRFTKKQVVLASNANVGGPTTAAAMCVARQWRSYFVPSMLVGIFGYTIATFVSIALGRYVLA